MNPMNLRTILAGLLLVSPGWAQDDSNGLLIPFNGDSTEGDSWDDESFDEDFAELDLADLLEVECTVVSREAESLDAAAAAVYVITGEEIRRAGHSSIQEALRMVPGMFVSHWSTQEWDSTIRGFGPGIADANQAYLNQVLVMIDGVVVYTPLFAGMWWGLQDFDLEHIDRIEVIRGPSGILWGANAFHGLINVITKDSAETQGLRLSARVSRDENFVTTRSSGRLSENATFSAFARRSSFDTLNFAGDDSGIPNTDIADWGINSGGFQVDAKGEEGRTWRAWARGYEAKTRVSYFNGVDGYDRFEDPKNGGQLAFAFNDPGTGTSVSAAYVKDRQRLFNTDYDVNIDHLQFEVRRKIQITDTSSVMFGAGYDRVDSDTDFFAGLVTAKRIQNNVRAFVSETWELPASHLTLNVGLQAIDHEFSGFDLQPSARASWSPPGAGNFWASASRAVRTPSLEEELYGSGTLDNESVFAFEAGWRGKIAGGVSIDLALYHNDYDDVRVRSFDPVTFLDTYSNSASGSSEGVELGVDIQAADWWTLRGAYSFHLSEHTSDGLDFSLDEVDGQFPVHMLNLRSYIDLADNWEVDAAAYLVERFVSHPTGGDGPEYWRGDVRLGWTPNDSVRVSLGVQGFNDPSRSEFGEGEVRRQVFVSLDLTR